MWRLGCGWGIISESINTFAMQLASNSMCSPFRLNLIVTALLLLATARFSQAQPAPEVLNISPAPESTVVQLTFINVIFNDAVLGVNASDLRINGAPTVRVA